MSAPTLLIAFPKGRLGDDLVPKLAGTPLALDPVALKSVSYTHLTLPTNREV